MPISFVRCLVTKEARPKRPRQEMKIANVAEEARQAADPLFQIELLFVFFIDELIGETGCRGCIS